MTVDLTEPRRVTFRVNPELHARMQKNIPWGLQGKLLEVLCETVVSALEDRGQIMVGAILGGKFVLKYEEKKDDK